MKIVQRLKEAVKDRQARKAGRYEPIYCTKNGCHSPKTMKESINQENPAHDHCFNISNCNL